MKTVADKQLNLQIKTHQHKRYRVDIVLDEGFVLKKFIVEEKVLRPEIMTSLYLAKWLLFNNGIYLNKTVLDMGCGSGILGTVTGLYGSRKICFTDISEAAINNVKQNVVQYGLENKSKVVQSDLFEKIKVKFDVIIFNHPFFGETNIKYADLDEITSGTLLKKFLQEAKKFLKKDGIIVMPYFHMAGKANDPATQAPKLGYKVATRLSLNAVTGVQKGPISIYELSL
jgi:release factor glutamine methyltransferase